MDANLNKTISLVLDSLAQAEDLLDSTNEAIALAKAKFGEIDIIMQCENSCEMIYRMICDAGVTIDAMLKEASKK